MFKETAVTWLMIVRDAFRLWLSHNAFSYAGSLAFYTLFSLAPCIIIAITVIGVILGEAAVQGELMAQLQETIGPDAAEAIEQAVAQSRIEASGLLPTLLGIGALLAGATTVFGQMQYSLNTLWGVTANPDRNSVLRFLKQRLLSLAVVLASGFVLLVSLILGVAMRAAFRYTGDWLPAEEWLLEAGELLVSLVVITLFFATIFKVLPDVIIGWRDVMVGAVVTAILFAIGRYAIAAYLAYTATASTYGAAGSLVLILLWVYYSSLILLFGAAFTRTQLEARGAAIVPRNLAIRVRQELLPR